ncbi:MAG: hypothetical protein M0009_14180 [Deltaproteobacteria bacterium]|nr:hypothetical protein [Deltaproteobacteria bacterium]
MYTKITNAQQYCLIFVLSVLVAFAAAPAFAAHWTVNVPADFDANVTECRITAWDTANGVENKMMKAGDTWIWPTSSDRKIQLLVGMCSYTTFGQTSDMRLLARTCKGNDTTDILSVNYFCDKDVTVKLCRKSSPGYGDYLFGFCPPN